MMPSLYTVKECEEEIAALNLQKEQILKMDAETLIANYDVDNVYDALTPIVYSLEEMEFELEIARYYENELNGKAERIAQELEEERSAICHTQGLWY
jgi:hypothetical protein